MDKNNLWKATRESAAHIIVRVVAWCILDFGGVGGAKFQFAGTKR